MTLARDSESSFEKRPREGVSPFAPVSAVRSLVVQLGRRGEAAQALVEAASERGHEARLTTSADECFWLVATGSVDLLAVSIDAANLSEARDLVNRVRAEETSQAMHLIGLVEQMDGGAASAVISAGLDDYILWPGGADDLVLRLQLAENLLKRRESGFRITQNLRQAEEKFENIFHETPQAILIATNDGGRILECNRSVERVLGYERGFLKGKNLKVLFPEIFQKAEGPLSQEAWIRAGSPVEVRYHKPREGLTFLEIEAVEVPWGDVRQLMVKVGDVKLRREIEKEQIAASKSESIRLLAGGVAHDFNNILTAIGGNIGLISQHSFLPPESRELLNRAEAACERARSLSEQLSMFASDGEFATGLRDVGALLRKSVQFALYGGVARPSFYIPDNLWPVYCDEGQISQVITNLTLNADQAMAGKGTTIGLHVACSNVTIPEGDRLPIAAGEYVRVSFKDEGPGIPAADIHRVFDPYFTTHNGLSGLGLATASTIVKNHRGYLRAESIEGEGALFEFFLPALSDPTMLEVAREVDAVAGESPEASRTRVLFMDDEPEIREVVKTALSRHGFEVYCAADGKEAIEVYEKSRDFGEPFEVLLFDLEVRGGLGGREAIQRLRQKYPHLKALVTSGHSDEKILEYHREAGFSGILKKPFRIERLVAAVTAFSGC